MDTFHKTQIRKNRVALINDMEAEPVVDYLNQVNVLTDAMMEDIRHTRIRREKVAKILDYVPRRGAKAFDHFYDALIETEQDHLAELICPERLSQTRAEANETTHRKSVIAQATTDREEEDEDKLPDNFPTDNIADFTVVDKLKDVEDPKLAAMLTKPRESVYRNFSKPRGRAVIFNNVKFEGDPRLERVGSDKDATQLTRLFEKLNYTVIVHTNKREEEMETLLTQESKEPSHAESHSFILVILSHGGRDTVYGSDMKSIRISSIVDKFNGKNCPSLLDKPKLFFIQACQGDFKDKGSGDTSTDGDLAEYFNELEIAGREVERADASNASLPTMADILVAMATTPDYVSWRNENLGTWFIIALVYAIARFAHKYDITKILTKVNHLVSKAQTERGKFRQVSQWSSSLRKDFYFFPGLHNT